MHLYNRLHNTRSYSYVIFTAIVLVCVYYVFVSSLCALIVLFITQPRFFTVTPGSNHCFWHCRVLLLQRFVPFYSHTTIQGNSPTAMLAQLCFFTCIFLLKIKKWNIGEKILSLYLMNLKRRKGNHSEDLYKGDKFVIETKISLKCSVTEKYFVHTSKFDVPALKFDICFPEFVVWARKFYVSTLIIDVYCLKFVVWALNCDVQSYK